MDVKQVSKVFEDRSNKLKELSEALASTLASQMVFKGHVQPKSPAKKTIEDAPSAQLTPPPVIPRLSFPGQENVQPTDHQRSTSGQQEHSPHRQQRQPSPRSHTSSPLRGLVYNYPKAPKTAFVENPSPMFSPSITPMARCIYSDEPCHERLYRQAMEKSERIAISESLGQASEGPASARGLPPSSPARAHVRSRSVDACNRKTKEREPVESESIAEALYQEAFTRRERSQMRQLVAKDRAQTERNGPKISKASEDLVRKRRDKELRDIWFTFVVNQADGQEKIAIEHQRINYEQLHKILKQMGFFNSLSMSNQSMDDEVQLTDRIWCAMNVDGMPFIQYKDFIRVIGSLLEPKKKVQRPKTASRTTSRSSSPRMTWEEAPASIQWDNQDALQTVNAVAAALNLNANSEVFSQDPAAGQPPLHPQHNGVQSLLYPESGDDDESQRINQQNQGLTAAQEAGAPPRAPRSTSASKMAEKSKQAKVRADSLGRKGIFRQDLSFHKLYKTGIGHAKSTKDSTPECYTFQPSINPNSRRLEVQYEEQVAEVVPGKKIPRYQSMLDRDKRVKKKLECIREEKESREVEQCTFKPAINKYVRPPAAREVQHQREPQSAFHTRAPGEHRLRQLTDPQPKTRSKTKQEIPHETTEDKEFKEFCTFKPKIPSQKSYEMVKRHQQRPDTTIARYDDHVKRLKFAQQEKLERQIWEENLKKGRPAHCDPAKYENHEKKTTPRPFEFQLDKRQRAKPLLYMDINLGPGRNGRLGIHENDDPAVLAKNFAASYQLDDTLRSKLENLLTQHMEQLVPGFKERNEQLKAESMHLEQPKAEQKTEEPNIAHYGNDSPSHACAGGVAVQAYDDEVTDVAAMPSSILMATHGEYTDMPNDATTAVRHSPDTMQMHAVQSQPLESALDDDRQPRAQEPYSPEQAHAIQRAGSPPSAWDPQGSHIHPQIPVSAVTGVTDDFHVDTSSGAFNQALEQYMQSLHDAADAR